MQASVRPEAPVDLSAGFHEKVCLSLIAEKSNIDLTPALAKNPALVGEGVLVVRLKSERTPILWLSSLVVEMLLSRRN